MPPLSSPATLPRYAADATLLPIFADAADI